MNCYTCKYRKDLPGSAHSSCHHPTTKENHDDPLGSIIALLGGNNDIVPKINIKANPHGIRSGWFNWPYDFDPVWLISCEGYEEK